MATDSITGTRRAISPSAAMTLTSPSATTSSKRRSFRSPSAAAGTTWITPGRPASMSCSPTASTMPGHPAKPGTMNRPTISSIGRGRRRSGFPIILRQRTTSCPAQARAGTCAASHSAASSRPRWRKCSPAPPPRALSSPASGPICPKAISPRRSPGPMS